MKQDAPALPNPMLVELTEEQEQSIQGGEFLYRFYRELAKKLGLGVSGGRKIVGGVRGK
jgi:hypothetical protein